MTRQRARAAIALSLSLLLHGATAHAHSRELFESEEYETDRLSVGLVAAVFVYHPGSIGEPGPAILLEHPLWLGKRYDHWQWDFAVRGLAGLGLGDAGNVYLSAAPTFGGHLFLGDHFSIEVHSGLSAFVQAGRHGTILGGGLYGSGAYVFHFEDHRERVKFGLAMVMGESFASEPPGDVAMIKGPKGIFLAYETAY